MAPKKKAAAKKAPAPKSAAKKAASKADDEQPKVYRLDMGESLPGPEPEKKK